ncbi:hypothetical protein MOD76_19640 [Bacillus spizizenii]|nr:hypothetical protein [Bacillus spizizenii]MCY8902936.1 hypothetical protein [Bacillus spizizenii]MCY8907039.1 hypothetical protein [Bacillus spizizenii]
MSVSVKDKGTYTIVQEAEPEGKEAIYYKESEVLQILESRHKAIQFTKEEIPFLEECLKQLKGEAE